MAQGESYDPRRVSRSQTSGWTLITHPELDKIHTWVRSVGELDAEVTRVAGEWWEIEITDMDKAEVKYRDQASSGVAAFAKVGFWAWCRMELKV
jgi:hypothetical protein